MVTFALHPTRPRFSASPNFYSRAEFSITNETNQWMSWKIRSSDPARIGATPVEGLLAPLQFEIVKLLYKPVGKIDVNFEAPQLLVLGKLLDEEPYEDDDIAIHEHDRHLVAKRTTVEFAHEKETIEQLDDSDIGQIIERLNDDKFIRHSFQLKQAEERAREHSYLKILVLILTLGTVYYIYVAYGEAIKKTAGKTWGRKGKGFKWK